MSTRSGKTEIVAGIRNGPNLNAALIHGLRAAHALLDRDDAGLPTILAAPDSSHQRQLICLAFLAPDIQEGIFAGRQPSGLTHGDLMDRKLPVVWADQRQLLGWPTVSSTHQG